MIQIVTEKNEDFEDTITSPRQIKVLTEFGERLDQISWIDIVIRPDEVVKAKMGLALSNVNIWAEPELLIQHPNTGLWLEVEKITFKNKAVWESQT
jgi:hypothetical protein